MRVIRLPAAGSRKQRANIQAQAALAELERLRRIGGFGYGDAAVLARGHDILKPVQAWCEQNSIPYFLSKERKSGIRLKRSREFVRLTDELSKESAPVAAERFIEIVRRQNVSAKWQTAFDLMAQDFCREYPADGGHPGFSVPFLKNWLYEYVGNDTDSPSDGLFLGTAHSAKGLEFKHVFILDGGWDKAGDDEQRLYYVAMTRAVETLTLFQNTPRHLWIEKLSHGSVETVNRNYAPLPQLDTEYRILSALGELDVGFIARDECCTDGPPSYGKIRHKLEAAARLQPGQELAIRRSCGRYQFLAGDTVVAQTAKKTALPELEGDGINRARAFAAAFAVRYRDEGEEIFRQKIPEKVDKWPIVIPMLVIPPQT
ncbi:3'-5' exonuclease [Kingella potus]|uniref:3'-5' exonuclease n=1 Tax=Kingella potus TaxID=265175 RepID=UPI001FD1B829|nr:3'-5' exonuclease [Kingella potus]UOP01885.1 ATP-binding domain-containing protein [Kingella potus]